MRYKITAITTICFILVLTAFTGSYAQEGKYEKNTLSITGQGKITASPDKASISIAVESRSDTAEGAVKDNSVKTNKVMEVIKAGLGEDDKVSTAGYNLSPVYEYNNETKKSEFKGYTASNQIIVETHNLNDLGKLIDSVAQAGSNRIDSLIFDTTEREAYRKQALEKAVKDARATAETVAGAAGVKIVKILSIRPTSDMPMPVYSDYAIRGKMAYAEAAPPPPPIEPGELTVKTSVNIVFEIE